MIRLTVTQRKRIAESLRKMPEDIQKATARAVNRASQSARTEIARKIRTEYVIKYGDILAVAKIRAARSDQKSISATIRIRGTRRELMQFKVRPSRPVKRPTMLNVEVRKGVSKPLPGAFVHAGRKSGKLRVLKRAGNSRYPIHIKYGPSIPEMAGTKEISQYAEQRAREVLDARLDHEINRVLGRLVVK